MKERTFISFDWAIKKVLRHKENFTVDQWMYFLKKSEIKDDFTAKGMEDAKRVLSYENMSKDDQIAYKRHVENHRIEISVIETAEDKGARKRSIEVAMTLLNAGSDKNLIAMATKLSLEEINKLEKGEDIDKDDDDE